MKEMENNEKSRDKKIEVFEQVVERKTETLEKIINKLNKVIEEKDDKIAKLGNKLDELEKKCTASKNNENINKKLQDLEKLINTEKKYNQKTYEKIVKLETNVKDITAAKFTCQKCEFTSSSEKGLKTHIKRIHEKENKKTEIKSFPVNVICVILC